ncbi:MULTISPECIES: nuclease-related domain-containing protein [Psychrobacter]|uniref:nuclease-related domain-containing protein n=1 Tax=Psychrobacter TaxID=497 RepID=UPI00146F2371|nr:MULTISPECIES: NERD domain-containing protein [Psychrobacter]
MSLLSRFKGRIGELIVSVATWVMLNRRHYLRLNNVTLPLSDGGTTQIDHIIVSSFGIFVIETKNYKGWIFGQERDAKWTQMIMGRKYQFQNPLRQNYLHMKTLSELLNLNLRYFHSVIAFMGHCEIKTRAELPENVLNKGMMTYIKSKEKVLLSHEQMTAIADKIEKTRLSKSRKTDRQHRDYLQNKFDDKKLKSERLNKKNRKSELVTVIKNDNTTPPNCPKCQGDMVKRTAKTGTNKGRAFFGCQNYPKCKGIVNIEA